MGLKKTDMYIESDFDRCSFNPLREIGKSVLGIYPDFKDRQGFLVGSFGVGLDREKVLRWIIALYQLDSPLVVDFPDYKKRRAEAGVIVGFKTKGGVFEDVYMDVLIGKNERVNKAIIEFCRMLRDDDYTELKLYQDRLYAAFDKLSVSEEAKDEKIIMENITRYKDKISELKKKFVVQDEDGRLMEEMMRVMDQDYVDMSREAIVRRIEKGEDIFGDRYVPPYGAEYVKEFYKDLNKERFHGGKFDLN